MMPHIVSTPASVPLKDNMVQPNSDAVRELREGRGLTQQTLADRAHLGKKTIENIEGGVKRVKRDTLALLADALGVNVDRIISTTAPQKVMAIEGPHPLPGPIMSSQFRETTRGKCSLLVVDDQPSMLMFLRDLTSLEFPSFEVLTAENADRAEEILRGRAVDIVLTDQNMPRRTGIQLLEWVRQHHPITTRLLMTGFDDIEEAKDAINRAHVYYFISKPFGKDHLVLLEALRHASERIEWRRRNDQLVEELQREKDDLKDANQRLKEANQRLKQELLQAAESDPLTGLFNRAKIEEIARFELRRHSRYQSALSIGLFEVDQTELQQFQPGSEQVLEKLAVILRTSLRELDSVGRLHGGRFMIVARETTAEGVAMLAERLQAKVTGTRFECNGQVMPVTLSIGVAVAEGGVVADHLTDMIQLADVALGQARVAGPGHYKIQELRDP